MAHTYYELTYIVNPVLEEDQLKATVDKFSAFLTDNGAVIDEVQQWGMRSLAYPIKKKSSGYYVNAYFTAPGAIIVKLERQLEIDDNVLRYLTIKYDNKMLLYREQQKKGVVQVLRERTEEDKK
jgi:small subunit ribosomal protein S6